MLQPDRIRLRERHFLNAKMSAQPRAQPRANVHEERQARPEDLEQKARRSLGRKKENKREGEAGRAMETRFRRARKLFESLKVAETP